MFSKQIESKSTMERTVLAKNTSITGEIISEGDFRIDGTIEGSLKTKGRVVIGLEGVIKGIIECNNADIEGEFAGELTVNNVLTIKSTANIYGDVIVGKLAVEPGALFNATCSMKGSVKKDNNDDNKTHKRSNLKIE